MDPRRPAVPIATESDPNAVLLHADGTFREHYNMIFSAEDVERIRLGYCCIQCFESQVGYGEGTPFPEQCGLCGYPMRARQAIRFAQEFQGEVRVGPTTSVDEELAIAEEWLERRELAQLGMKKTGSIVVPRGI